MQKLTIGILSSAFLASILLISILGSVEAVPPSTPVGFVFTQADHGLVDVASSEKGFCGSTGEPWILNIEVADDGSGGSVKLTFNDGDSITYPVAAGSSFSAQFNFGGADDGVTDGDQVDNVVMIEGSGGVTAMVVSAMATHNSVDPFDEDDDGLITDGPEDLSGVSETDNYCVVDASEMDVEEDSGDTNGDAFGFGHLIIGTP